MSPRALRAERRPGGDAHRATEERRELEERRALAARDVVDATGDAFGDGRSKVRLDDIRHVDEVPALEPVTEDDDGLLREEPAHEDADHAGVGRRGILPRSEDVEIAERDGLDTVEMRERRR